MDFDIARLEVCCGIVIALNRDSKMEMDADADLGERLYEACARNNIKEAAGLIAQGPT